MPEEESPPEEEMEPPSREPRIEEIMSELIEPDADMRALVEAVQRILPLDFAGVDLLRRQDGSYLLGEIEDAVGCRMLYQLTGKDPAKDFIAGIAQKLSGMLS